MGGSPKSSIEKCDFRWNSATNYFFWDPPWLWKAPFSERPRWPNSYQVGDKSHDFHGTPLQILGHLAPRLSSNPFIEICGRQTHLAPIFEHIWRLYQDLYEPGFWIDCSRDLMGFHGFWKEFILWQLMNSFWSIRTLVLNDPFLSLSPLWLIPGVCISMYIYIYT